MAQTTLTKTITRISMIALICGTFAGCAEKDLYDPDRGKNQLPPEESYFGYEMRGDVKLSINYDAPGFQAIVEIYDQNPITENGVKKEGIKALYSAYINDGKLQGNMYVPTALKEAYLYTDNWSLPQCVKMELTKENGAVYDATKQSVASRGATTRAFFGDKIPYKIADASGNRYTDVLYSLCKWGYYGIPTGNYLSQTSTVKDESVASISARVLDAFDNTTDKSSLLRSAEVTNINIKEDNTVLDVVLLAERGSYHNTFGYYYYKTGQAPAESALNMYAQKYIIFPDPSIDNLGLACGATARLQFFGEDGKGDATENFPQGYTIGWFFICNGFDTTNDLIKDNPNNAHFYSDNTNNHRRFVSLNDKKSEIVVLGFEDSERFENADDYSDVLFFVKSNKDIKEDGRPEIPGEKPQPKPGTFTIEGTLAFEDIWPSGGDYDMNDVVVEYKRTVDYDTNNNATKITEKFTPVNDGASLANFFAYQVKSQTIVAPQQGVVFETGTNSIIINSSIKTIQKKEYIIERTFGTTINKDNALKDFNPFIIVGKYDIDGQNRKEVHLPKKLPTAYADKSLNYTENDAYYIQKDGKYPFAIDIPVLGFKVVTEKGRIDDDGEYPAFRTWADSKGTEGTEWYIKK